MIPGLGWDFNEVSHKGLCKVMSLGIEIDGWTVSEMFVSRSHSQGHSLINIFILEQGRIHYPIVAKRPEFT